MKSFFKRSVASILAWEARLTLKKYKPKIVGVTGSVGKTSTKDAIYTALAAKYRTRKSEKSYNTEIGVPLTILGLRNAHNDPLRWLINIIEGLSLILFKFSYPEWLVLEVGAEKPRDIRSIAEWLKPDVVVITRFGDVPVHIEFFNSIEDLIFEKGALAQALKPGGTLVVNFDDKHAAAFGDELRTAPLHDFKKMTYGFNLGAEIQGTDDHIIYAPYQNSNIEFPEGMSTNVSFGGQTYFIPVHGAIGRQHMYPILAACAVGLSQGINLETLQEALQKHMPPRGRMRLIPGIKDSFIIDDSYNASPVAMHAALATLKELKCAGKKIAVLGDMLQLGQYSIDEHKKLGEAVVGVADILVAVGVRARGMAEAALNNGMDENNVLQFETSQEAGKFIETIIKEGDIILVKGSQTIRMERVVEEIMQHPEEKEKLLVRQDAFWQSKK